jgi:hypothetical protein
VQIASTNSDKARVWSDLHNLLAGKDALADTAANSRSDTHCAIVVGRRQEPSGESHPKRFGHSIQVRNHPDIQE